MLFKSAAQGDERAYMTIKNVEASSMTTGYLVALCLGTAASFDGTQAVLAASGTNTNNQLSAFVGVAVKDIPSNAYGLIQTYGAVASVAMSWAGVSVTVNLGDPLCPGPAKGTAASVAAPTWALSGFKYIIASNVNPNLGTMSGVGYISGWIRGVL